MTTQLRIYTIGDGQMDQFVSAWRNGVVPLRRKLGWTIEGAWIVAESNEFVWIVGYDGPMDWEAKNREYYESPERKALDPDPRQFIVEMTLRIISPTPLEG